MFFYKKITFIFVVIISLCTNLFSNVLETSYRQKASGIYCFNENLIRYGSTNKLICVCKDVQKFTPYTEITKNELEILSKYKVDLIKFSPNFDSSLSLDVGENLKRQTQLGIIKAYGMHVWCDVLSEHIYPVTSNDVRVINDPSTEQDWINAVSVDETFGRKIVDLARAWDLRIDFLLQKRMAKWGRGFCETFGVRIADNPIFGVWAFESNWLDKMNNDEWCELPMFFIDSLTVEWNNWVYNEVVNTTADFKEKYSFLVDGESIEDGTLKLVVSKQHTGASDNEKWITLDDETRVKYENSTRCQLQKDFFAQLYLKHIERLKDSFKVLGTVTRDAPYFVTMSTNANDNISLTDIYFGATKKPYVFSYSSDLSEGKTFLSAKNFYEKNSEASNASIILVSHDDIIKPSLSSMGIVYFANTTYAIEKQVGCFSGPYPSKVEEHNFELSLGDLQPTAIAGFDFSLLKKDQKDTNNKDFYVKVNFVLYSTTINDKTEISSYICLEYDKSLAENLAIQIRSDLRNNYLLTAFSNDAKTVSKVYRFKEYAPITIPLSQGCSFLFIEKQIGSTIFPLEF